MLIKTRGIFLHYIKYTESSVIATIFTEEFGKLAFILQGIRSKKSNHKINILQALYILEIEVSYKANRNLQRIHEMKICYPFNSIPFDIRKSTISIFIAELLFKTLADEEVDKTLFQFLVSSISELDKLEKNISNFHLYFLISYLKYTGFTPKSNFSSTNKYFDLRSGQFVYSKFHDDILPEKESIIFSAMLMHEDFLNEDIKIENPTRSTLLEKTLYYYYWHFDGLKPLKSLQILKEIFK